MNRKAMAALLGFAALTLSGCGGGGGGSGGGGGVISPPPDTKPAATKATTRVSVFGAMSSNGRIATVQTSMPVPSGVMVNYSSPGANGVFPLRSGVITPAGPVKVNNADFSNSWYDTATRKLTIVLVNISGRALTSNKTGNGVEIAAINFTVPSGTSFLVGDTATTPPDNNISVYQDRLPGAYGLLGGITCNFSTTFE